MPSIGTTVTESNKNHYTDQSTTTEIENIESLTEKSSIDDIVAATVGNATLSKPTLLVYYTKSGRCKKYCDELFKSLANLVKRDNAISLSNVFDTYKIEVRDSVRFKSLNSGKLPLLVVLDTQKNIVAKVGGKSSSISGATVFKTLCSGSKKIGFDLKKAVTAQDKLIKEILSLTQKIAIARGKLQVAQKANRETTVTNCQKVVSKYEKELSECLSSERKIWNDIRKKIADKANSKVKA